MLVRLLHEQVYALQDLVLPALLDRHLEAYKSAFGAVVLEGHEPISATQRRYGRRAPCRILH